MKNKLFISITSQIGGLKPTHLCEARAEGKTRHPGHLDPLLVDELREELSKGWIDPLDLPGVLVRVDTSNTI
jgi:hypothetical protein